ncbi:MAG: type II secretion system major pseudopilin GspG [Treponema sp.]|nr:type II secretion system major pseudopilin GspG [Treponema sp.]
MKSQKRKVSGIDAGFTFVETLAVLAVTAVLAGQAAVAANALLQRARIAGTKTQIESLKIALHSYYIDCGSFPTEEQGLSALWQKPQVSPVPENWNGPYTDKLIPKDPWGNEYQYAVSGSPNMPPEMPDGLPFVIFSYGADKKEGGDGKGKDIISWQ